MQEESEVARTYANIKTDIWGSVEWKQLSTQAQWLYFMLLTHESLSRVGVAEWRPGRIGALAADASAAAVSGWAEELERGRFVFVDEESEEVLIRSYLKHDGLLLNPNMYASIGAAFAGVYSATLQRRIAHEMQKLREANPHGFPTTRDATKLVSPWSSDKLATILGTEPLKDDDQRLAPTPASSEQPTTTRERKPRKSGVPYSPDFEKFWVMGLRKEGKGDAWKAWEKTRKAGLLPDLAALEKAVQNYVAHNPDVGFQKHPATWLNSGSWDDDYAPAPQAGPKKERLR